MTVEELRALLEPHGIRPLRERGQHFLLDDLVVAQMIDAAGVEPFTHVVEIGPGPGILTGALLAKGAEVVAVELDKRLVKLLRDRFAAEPRLQVLDGDVRAFSNATLSDTFHKPGRFRVVANLPYGITSDMLLKFLLGHPRPESITVMIQREVADRVLAKPGDMSAIAVFVQTLAEARRVVNVPASSFFPPPKVNSAVIHITPKDDHFLAKFFGSSSREKYFALVRTGFASKRKQLKNTLAALEPNANRLTSAFVSAEIEQFARPEELSIEDWRRLAAALA